MKIIVLLNVFLFLAMNVLAEDIASCSNLKGVSYFPFNQSESSNVEGFVDDGITGGIVKLQKNIKNEFNILIVDASKNIISSVDEGAIVSILNKTDKMVSFIVYYPGQTMEVFTFFTNTLGNKMIYTINRGSSSAITTKASMFTAECSYINFDLLE